MEQDHPLLRNLNQDLLRFSKSHLWYKHLSFEGKSFLIFPWKGQQPQNVFCLGEKDDSEMHWWIYYADFIDEIPIHGKGKEIVMQNAIILNCFLRGMEEEGVVRGWYMLTNRNSKLKSVLRDQYPHIPASQSELYYQLESMRQLEKAKQTAYSIFNFMSNICPEWLLSSSPSVSVSPISLDVSVSVSPISFDVSSPSVSPISLDVSSPCSRLYSDPSHDYSPLSREARSSPKISPYFSSNPFRYCDDLEKEPLRPYVNNLRFPREENEDENNPPLTKVKVRRLSLKKLSPYRKNSDKSPGASPSTRWRKFRGNETPPEDSPKFHKKKCNSHRDERTSSLKCEVRREKRASTPSPRKSHIRQKFTKKKGMSFQ